MQQQRQEEVKGKTVKYKLQQCNLVNREETLVYTPLVPVFGVFSLYPQAKSNVRQRVRYTIKL